MTPHQRDTLKFLAANGPALFTSGVRLTLTPAPERALHGRPVVRGQKVLFNSLVRRGWIEPVMEPTIPGAATPRLLYRITDDGKTALAATGERGVF